MINHLIPFLHNHPGSERKESMWLTHDTCQNVHCAQAKLKQPNEKKEEHIDFDGLINYISFRMGVMAKKYITDHTLAVAGYIKPITRLFKLRHISPSIKTYGKINIQNHYNLYNFFVNRQLIIMGDFFRPHMRASIAQCLRTSFRRNARGHKEKKL